MALPTPLQSVVTFLRAGYPDGVPEQDYIPLLALLRRQLTDEEVVSVADGLANGHGPTSPADIRAAITAVTRNSPSDTDLGRVRARLAAGGWPLAPADRLT